MLRPIIFVLCLIGISNAFSLDGLSWRGIKPQTKIKENPFYKTVDLTDSSVLDKISAAWVLFKENFKREFKDAIEEGERFFIFAGNFMKIHQHNAEYAQGKHSYELAVNKFSDMRESELQQRRGYKPELKFHRSFVKGSTYMSPILQNYALPKSVDWRTKGAVTPVKDQGQCGSCWAFSTTGSLEGQHFRKTGKLVSLSEQQLVDCSQSFGNMGCNGGLMDNAFQYIKKNHGLDSEKSYPYVSGQTHHAHSTCSFHQKDVAADDTGFVDVPSNNETALAEAVSQHGPVSVAINAALPEFMMYRKGIFDPTDCPPNLDHGVLVVGYGTENGIDYWIVKNSWGESWGEEGYIRMVRNKKNSCGIASQASYPLV